MRLLLVVPHFPPDDAPTGEVAGRWVDALAGAGHRVEVVTSLPWYRSHAVEPGWRGRPVRIERTPWGRVVRLHPMPASDKTRLRWRAASFVGFSGLAGIAALAGRRVDGVIAMSPPLTLGVAGWAAARARRAPLVLNLQDVYPDVLVDTGAVAPGRLVDALGRLERWCYARADAVTVLSTDLADNVAPRVPHPAKVRVIPNFVDLDRITPGPRDNAYRDELGLGERTVVMYAGNVGYSQPLELLVEAADALSGRDDVVFVVNGGGSGLGEVRRLAEGRGLTNVVFVPLQPRARVAEVLAAADLHLIALRPGLAKASVPSKLYSIMAAGRPVVASIDPGSEVARVLADSRAGRTVPPGDAAALTAAIGAMVDDPAELVAAGRRARQHVEGWLSPDGVARAYVALLDELTGGRGQPEASAHGARGGGVGRRRRLVGAR